MFFSAEIEELSEPQKLSVWGRQSTFAGSSGLNNNRNSRARSENRSGTSSSYGFGSGTERFSFIQSQPNSPMQERLAWFVKDIDIGDAKNLAPPETKSGPPEMVSGPPEMFGHRPLRRRSRHDCHFQTGSHVPVGKGKEKRVN